MKFVLPLMAFAISFISCKHEPIIIDNTTTYSPIDSIVIPVGSVFSCDSDSVYFNEQVLPIFINSCAVSGCHDQETHEEGLILDSYTHIINSDEITPYDIYDGDIYEVITLSPYNRDFMPPSDSDIDALTDNEINTIAYWINQGLPNNSCPDLVCDTLEVTFSGDIQPMIDNFCSGCHTGTNVSNDVYLENYDQIKFQANSGALIGTISNTPYYPVMPSNTTGLSDCQIRMVEMWIEDGMPNN